MNRFTRYKARPPLVTGGWHRLAVAGSAPEDPPLALVRNDQRGLLLAFESLPGAVESLGDLCEAVEGLLAMLGDAKSAERHRVESELPRARKALGILEGG